MSPVPTWQSGKAIIPGPTVGKALGQGEPTCGSVGRRQGYGPGKGQVARRVGFVDKPAEAGYTLYATSSFELVVGQVGACQRPGLAGTPTTKGLTVAAPVPGGDGVARCGRWSPRRSHRASGTRPRYGGSPSAGSPGPGAGRGRRPRRPGRWVRYGRGEGRSTTGRRGPGASATAWPA